MTFPFEDARPATTVWAILNTGSRDDVRDDGIEAGGGSGVDRNNTEYFVAFNERIACDRVPSSQLTYIN